MQKQHILLIAFLLIILIIINSISPYAVSSLEAVLGKKTTHAMLDEIVTRVDDYSAITEEMFYEIVYDVTTQYGIELNENEFNEILSYVSSSSKTRINEHISLIDQIKIFIADFTGFIEQTFPSIKDKEVTITIPKISQIDEWVNEGLHYFKRNVLPLITE